MRRALVLFLLVGVLVAGWVPPARADGQVRVEVNGREVVFDVPPVIEAGRTLVPLRAVFEALGAEVSWDGATRTVTARRAGVEVKLTIGSQVAYRDGREVRLDVPAKLVGNRTLVPLRFVSESLGAVVSWDGRKRLVSVTLGEPGWVTRRDPCGLVVVTPSPPWEVRHEDTGLVRVVAPSGDAEVYLWGAVLNEGAGLDESGVTALLEGLVGGCRVVSCRRVAGRDAWVARAVIEREGAGWPGVFVCAEEGVCGSVSGFAAHPSAYSERLPVLLKVLALSGFDPNLADLEELVGVEGFDSYRDPHEGAFTVLVPRGWKVMGGLDRPYIDAGVRLELTGGECYVLFASPYPPYYVVPNWILQALGFTEGSRYNPWGHFWNPYGQSWDMVVRGYRDAAAYLREVLAPEIEAAHPGARLVWVKERPEVAEGVPEAAGVTECTAAEARFEGPGDLVHGCVVVDQLMTAGETGMWGVALVYWRAPASRAAAVQRVVSVMERSFRVDPAWAKREAEEVNKRVGAINRTGDDIARIVESVYRYRAGVDDRLRREWTKVVLGLEYVADPETGEVWEVPHYSRYYWRRGSEIYGTEGPSPPWPDPEFVELVPVK